MQEHSPRPKTPPDDGARRRRASNGGTRAPDPDPLVRFALERMHDAADLLHAQVEARIDRAGAALGALRVQHLLSRSMPLLLRGAAFTRRHPLRVAAMLALIAAAALLARTPSVEGGA